jgi:hypothetical protein
MSEDTLYGVRTEFQVTRDAASGRRRQKANGEQAPVKVIRPDPELYAYALEAAANDPRRIEVLSRTDLRIHNHPIR